MAGRLGEESSQTLWPRLEVGLRMTAVRKYVAAAVLAMLLSVSAGPAWGAGGTAELYKAFGVSEQHAHYVIAVDTSLSMTERFEEVGPALRVLTSLMEPGDRVSVVAFDKHPRLLWSGKIGNDRKRLLTALPKKANRQGTRTDIGAAVGKIIARTDIAPESLQVVFFLTDGHDEPPGSSDFSGPDREAAWAALRRRAARSSGKLIKVYGIGLDTGATDVDLLKRVFADVGRVTVQSRHLSAYFQGLKSELRRQRLRALVKKELATGSVAYRVGPEAWQIGDDGRARGSIEIVSDYKKLQVRVERLRIDLGVAKEGGVLRADKVRVGRRHALVAPGARIRVPVTVTFHKTNGRLKFGERRLREAVPLVARAAARVEPGTAISALGLDQRVKVEHDRLVAQADSYEGIPYTYIAAAGMLALLVGAAFFKVAVAPGLRLLRRLSGPPALFGRLTFLETPSGEHPPSPVSLAGKGHKVSLGGGGQVALPALGGRAGAELYTKWEGRKEALVLRRLSGSVRVRQARYYPPMQVLGEFDLKKGSIIELGGYKIQWL